MTQHTIPAFNADSPDAEILEAFEKVRAGRSWSYHEQDDLNREVPDDFDDKQFALERIVQENWATTPSGVAAQIALVITGDQARWVDRALADTGFLGLYKARARLDGNDRLLVTAAYELLHMEWQQALSDYLRSEAVFRTILEIQGAAEGLEIANGPDVDKFAAQLKRAEDVFSNVAEINHLLRTLAPDWDCYRRKAEISIAEGLASEAAPWLFRDVNFLTGSIAEEEKRAEAA